MSFSRGRRREGDMGERGGNGGWEGEVMVYFVC